ncbi:MAG: hypothetical protein NTX50_26230 [Candidatus Sumerlaeota bacterium]|nr:hypothetical protein [Candidatus Sumerlaeota bacterium]
MQASMQGRARFSAASRPALARTIASNFAAEACREAALKRANEVVRLPSRLKAGAKKSLLKQAKNSGKYVMSESIMDMREIRL